MQENGFDISDNGEEANNFDRESDYSRLLVGLTAHQRKVAELLAKGYSRGEVAEMFGIGIQGIHQMVARIRSKIIKNGGFHDRTRR
jgi:DNA-binding CsgD family transcriptional regulator